MRIKKSLEEKPKRSIQPLRQTVREDELKLSFRTLRKKPFTKILRKARLSLEPEWK